MGTMAEYCLTTVGSLAKFPSNVISFNEAASIPLASLTAYQALVYVMKVKSGDKLLILGGSGGVGIAAIQIAKILGCHVITTCSTKKVDLCKSLGADDVIDYTKEKYQEKLKNLDAIFDTVGDTSCYSCLKPNALFCSTIASLTLEAFELAGVQLSTATKALIGTMSAPTLLKAKMHNIEFKSIWMWPSAKDLNALTSFIEKKQFKPVIDKLYRLQQFKEAFDHLEDGHCAGKVVLSIQEAPVA